MQLFKFIRINSCLWCDFLHVIPRVQCNELIIVHVASSCIPFRGVSSSYRLSKDVANIYSQETLQVDTHPSGDVISSYTPPGHVTSSYTLAGDVTSSYMALGDVSSSCRPSQGMDKVAEVETYIQSRDVTGRYTPSGNVTSS